MTDPLREALQEQPAGMVELPAPVASRLGLPPASLRTAFVSHAIDWLERRPARAACAVPSEEIVYQVFVECFAGFKGELGTLVSFACYLPFIVEDLCATAILSLPLLARGASERKGRSSSPFAIASRTAIAPHLAEGDGARADDLWQHLVACCARIGVRLGMILPMSTIAIDSPLIRHEPDLVFWWGATLDETLTGTVTGDRRRSPEAVPLASALSRFVRPPHADQIETVQGPRGLRFVAVADGDRITPSNAYPDPVVGDDATYAWNDVAAVRFGTSVSPAAYRAGRCDVAVAPARRHVGALVAASRRRGERLLLADVSSALPDDALGDVCRPYPDAFVIAEQLWHFHDRRPIAFITGPLVPCVAAHHRDPELMATSLVYHLEMLATTRQGPHYLAGVANHDSPPCAPEFVAGLLTLFLLLPRSIPFVYSGTDAGTATPTNLEFGSFDVAAHGLEDGLLLFNHRHVPIDDGSLASFGVLWRDLLAIRRTLGTAELDGSAVHHVERRGLLVSTGLGPHCIHVNLGSTPAVVALPAAAGGILGACAFAVTGASVRVPARSAVVLLSGEERTAERTLVPLRVVRHHCLQSIEAVS